MNSRLDWLVLSDYYLIYVTNAPPKNSETRSVFPNFFSSIVEFERVGSRLANDTINNNKSMPTKQPMKRLFATPA